MNDPACPACQGTGSRDSGGFHPWGEAIMVPCDCSVEPNPAQDAEATAPLIAQDATWLIFYDDHERRPEVLDGEAIARERFRRISTSWNANLFVKVASNSRDDRHASNNAVIAPRAAPTAAPELLEALKTCHDALVRIREAGGASTSAEIVAERLIAIATPAAQAPALVPLTDAQIAGAAFDIKPYPRQLVEVPSEQVVAFVRNIEAAHGITPAGITPKEQQ